MTSNGEIMILNINGESKEAQVAENTPLLWVIRDALGLTGTKFGCGVAACGACTVHVDGEAVRSCVYPVSLVKDKKITTIEGLDDENALHPVQEAWVEQDVPQCGYCQSGQIMAVVAFLKVNPNPTEEDIKNNITNLCRCGTYQDIKEAIFKASKLLAKEV